MTSSEGVDPDSDCPAAGVVLALTQLGAALDGLLAVAESGGLDPLDPLELVAFLREFERVRNRMSLVDHRVLADAERRGLAAELTHSNLKSVLVQTLRLSPAEASRRVRAAAAVGSRISMLGEELAPVRPQLAAAQRTGEVSAKKVRARVDQMRAQDLGKLRGIIRSLVVVELLPWEGSGKPNAVTARQRVKVTQIDPEEFIPAA